MLHLFLSIKRRVVREPQAEPVEEPFPIAMLPSALVPKVLANLTPNEVLELSRRGPLFYAMANQDALWWYFINRYFPNIHLEKRIQYEKNPKALFILQFESLSFLIDLLMGFDLMNSAVSKTMILNALLGDIRPLDTQRVTLLLRKYHSGEVQASKMLTLALSLARASGHQVAMFESDQSNCKAFDIEVLRVFLDTYQMLNPGNPPSAFALLVGNATSGRLMAQNPVQVLEWLPFGDGVALVMSSFGGYLDSVKFLLEQRKIRSIDLSLSARIAAKRGHLAILMELENHIKIHLELKELLSEAVYHGRLNIVKYLVENHCNVMSSYIVELLLHFARDRKHRHIADYLLEHCHDRLYLATIVNIDFIGQFNYYSSCIADGYQSIYPVDLYEAQPMQEQELVSHVPALLLSQNTARRVEPQAEVVIETSSPQSLIKTRKK